MVAHVTSHTQSHHEENRILGDNVGLGFPGMHKSPQEYISLS